MAARRRGPLSSASMGAPDRKPLYFTFANHMHWVDMTWLWGPEVLGLSTRDMLRLARESGTRGNVNFDGVGYERLAVEDPAALEELRAAVADGTIDVVGASYGQPYGLFHGGESNIRQRLLGARAVRRLLGVWPPGTATAGVTVWSPDPARAAREPPSLRPR